MDCLARREHSRLELERKLCRRFEATIVTRVIDELAEENLQSDVRFAESYTHHRSTRGFGPARIRSELRERGIEDTLIEAALAESDVDWRSLARTVLQKKFGLAPPADFRERARRARFLNYRGFSADQGLEDAED
jgi:regulatory protein